MARTPTLRRGYGYISPADPNQRPYRIVTHPKSGERFEVCVQPQPTDEAPLGWWASGDPDTIHRWRAFPDQDWRDVN